MKKNFAIHINFLIHTCKHLLAFFSKGNDNQYLGNTTENHSVEKKFETDLDNFFWNTICMKRFN